MGLIIISYVAFKSLSSNRMERRSNEKIIWGVGNVHVMMQSTRTSWSQVYIFQNGLSSLWRPLMPLPSIHEPNMVRVNPYCSHLSNMLSRTVSMVVNSVQECQQMHLAQETHKNPMQSRLKCWKKSHYSSWLHILNYWKPHSSPSVSISVSLNTYISIMSAQCTLVYIRVAQNNELHFFKV